MLVGQGGVESFRFLTTSFIGDRKSGREVELEKRMKKFICKNHAAK